MIKRLRQSRFAHSKAGAQVKLYFDGFGPVIWNGRRGCTYVFRGPKNGSLMRESHPVKEPCQLRECPGDCPEKVFCALTLPASTPKGCPLKK